MKKYNELFQEVNELVVGMQELLERSQELAFSDLLEWMQYMTRNEEVDKTFRLAAPLHYVEAPDDKSVVDSLKRDMKTNKGMIKLPTKKIRYLTKISMDKNPYFCYTTCEY